MYEAHGKLGARCAADLSKRLPFTELYNFVYGVHASLIYSRHIHTGEFFDALPLDSLGPGGADSKTTRSPARRSTPATN
jgi:hypothetical protein